MTRFFGNLGLYFLVIVQLLGCSGISTLADKSVNKSLYSEYFLSSIEKIKESYQNGKANEALSALKKMKEEDLLPSERSLRRNLLGVILFSKKEYEQAIYHFELALVTSRLDNYLDAQINLNLGSTYYKMSLFEKAFSAINLVKKGFLNEKELKNYQNLRFKLAREIGNQKEALFSLTRFLGDKETVRELISSPNFEFLKKVFFGLSRTERFRFLEDFSNGKLFCVGYLAYLQAEKLFYRGDKSEAKDLMLWLEKEFGDADELMTLVRTFSGKVSHDNEIDPYSIGVVLPLSGPKSIFGKRALEGIDSGFRDFLRRKNGGESSFKMFVEDSKGSAVIGSYSVKRLIQKHKVSVIIGGLFSDEAEREYIEAKKKGIFFVSLSQVYLPKEKKDHL